MKKTAAIRITADICFYFSILSIFQPLAPWRSAMMAFAAASFFAAWLATECSAAPLRFLLGLLPAACFLLGPLRPMAAIPAAAALYLLLMLSFGGFYEDLYEYRGRYRFMLIVSLFFVAANLANIAIYRGRVFSPQSLVYLFLFLTLGVIALRRMQMGVEMDRSWKLSNAATVLLVPLIAVGVSFALYELVRLSVPFWQFLLAPIANGIVWLFVKLFGTEGAEQVLETPAPSATPPISHKDYMDTSGSGSTMEDHLINEMMPRIFTEDLLTPIAYFLAALIVIAMLWLIWTLLRRGLQRVQAQGIEYEETEQAEPMGRARRRGIPPERKNARRIRQIYREYLEFQSARGGRIRKDSTSLDVLEEAEGSEEDEKLRAVYIAARYRGTASEADVNEAERCFREIRARSGK